VIYLGYYGYLLSEVHATNLFCKMFKNGSVLDEKVTIKKNEK
jgi:hypothetical protein